MIPPPRSSLDSFPANGIRPPDQQRARRTMNRLLDGAAALLEDRSLDALSVGAVLRQTGVSNGAFYTRFRDREALITALFERFERERAAALEELEFENWKGRSPREPVAALVRIKLRWYRERGGLIRALREQARTRPTFRATAAAMMSDTARVLSRALYIATWNKPTPALEENIAFAVRAVYGLLDQVFLFEPASARRRELAEREIETRLIDLTLRTLGMGQLL